MGCANEPMAVKPYIGGQREFCRHLKSLVKLGWEGDNRGDTLHRPPSTWGIVGGSFRGKKFLSKSIYDPHVWTRGSLFVKKNDGKS